MQSYANTRVNGQVFAPALRDRRETVQHRVTRSKRIGCAAAAFAVRAESGHDPIAGHVIDLAAELIRCGTEHSEEFVQQRDDARGRQALHHTRIAPQVSKQHRHFAGAYFSRLTNPGDEDGTCGAQTRTSRIGHGSDYAPTAHRTSPR